MSDKVFLLIDAALLASRIPDDEDREEMASQLVRMQRYINWWLGDMVVYGEAQIGDDIYQAFPTDVSESLLSRCAAVSRAYTLDERNPQVSWTHHLLAMRLPKRVREMALGKAELEQWDTGAFKNYLSSLRGVIG